MSKVIFICEWASICSLTGVITAFVFNLDSWDTLSPLALSTSIVWLFAIEVDERLTALERRLLEGGDE